MKKTLGPLLACGLLALAPAAGLVLRSVESGWHRTAGG